MRLFAKYSRIYFSALVFTSLCSQSVFATPLVSIEGIRDRSQEKLKARIQYIEPRKHNRASTKQNHHAASALAPESTQLSLTSAELSTRKKIEERIASCRKKYDKNDPRLADALESLARPGKLVEDQRAFDALKEAEYIRMQHFNLYTFRHDYIMAFGKTGEQTLSTGVQGAIDLDYIARLYLQHTRQFSEEPAYDRSGGRTAQEQFTLLKGMSIGEGLLKCKQIADTDAEMLGPDNPRSVESKRALATMFNHYENFRKRNAVGPIPYRLPLWNMTVNEIEATVSGKSFDRRAAMKDAMKEMAQASPSSSKHGQASLSNSKHVQAASIWIGAK